MSRTCPAVSVALTTALALGCSAGGNSDSLVVGSVGSGGTSQVPPGSGGTLGFGGGGRTSAFNAHVESPRGVVVEFITLSCDNACAEVMAVATGGNEPYSYAWEDGSTGAARRVCPTAATSYEVTVTDSGVRTGELQKPPQTAKAPLTASLLRCEDSGGVPIPDAGVTGPCDSLAASFVGTGSGANPTGPWSYGWSPALGGAFTLFSTYYPFTPASLGAYNGVGYPDAAQWFDKVNGYVSADTGFSIPPLPEIEFNPMAEPSHPGRGNLAGDSWTLLPGQAALAPGRSGQYAIARWTAPASGAYTVRAVFDGRCGDNNSLLTTADVHVQHNGTDVGGASINVNGGGNTFSFTQVVAVAAGDTIDFAVGPAGGVLIVPDAVGIDARVCAPAP